MDISTGRRPVGSGHKKVDRFYLCHKPSKISISSQIRNKGFAFALPLTVYGLRLFGEFLSEKVSNSGNLTVECLTVPLWYKQQVTFLNSKFD